MKEINNEEWIEINNNLEKHHAVFYKLWQIGKPYFTDRTKTAAIEFDSNGEFLNFLFNKNFWEKISFRKKLFVICHEVLHILLDHGKRAKSNSYSVNCLLDVVINHMLINKFNFKKSEIENCEEYCWIETVFKGMNPLPPTNECFEYYYKIYKQHYGDGNCGDGTNNPKTLDDHDFFGGKYSEKQIDEVLNQIKEDLTEDEKESFVNKIKSQIDELNKKRNKDAYGDWIEIKKEECVKKAKWESVIKKWSIQSLKRSEKEKEQWAKTQRRMFFFNKNIFLPSEIETDSICLEKIKTDLWFFLDASGSCIGFKDRFFKAARSLPEDKFKISLFSFDTKVQELDINKNRIYGGGGTKFQIMEEKIQATIKKDKTKYPNAIFVITDGDGDKIAPEFPERWHWFLTKNSKKSLIDKKCNIYNLDDYE